MIKVQDIVYTEFSLPDLDKQEAFLTDFGMTRADRTQDALYMRGRGKFPYMSVCRKGEPGFLAVAWLARSREDLETIAGHPDALGGVEPIGGPGGGERVRLNAPDGFEFHIVHGLEPAEELPMRAPLKINFAQGKSRAGEFQRPEPVPCEIYRLGHCVLKASDADTTIKWLEETLGLIKTDRLYVPDDETQTLGTFLHIDRGDDWTDHHSMLILHSPDDVKVHHTSYETQDPDAVFIGAKVMEQGGWHREWGIGRHVLGSQIFDYWRDPWGFMWEHYADGDLVNKDHQMGNYPGTPENLAQWGPEVTETFFN
ncbi:MAG: VOC family protein [Bauldia litoralis]